MLTIAFPNIDPVAISIGPIDIRWYGISYVVGIVLAWLYSRYLVTRYSDRITVKHLDDFVVWATIGVVVGGRLGEVLFYMPTEFISRPWEILYLWRPGMSFHGGLIGVFLVTVWFTRSRSLPFLAFADILGSAAPIGLFFGRIANFINAELYGRVTDVSWGMVFPNGGPQPRHPSQLYEAALEGFAIFFGLLILEHTTQLRRNKPGFTFGLFLIGYALARSFVELYRQPEESSGLLIFGTTIGQWLSAPVLLAGLFFIVYSIRQQKAH
jgi:phosphatidylglycerol---prolipoprotein diacylglyceryl transferase